MDLQIVVFHELRIRFDYASFVEGVALCRLIYKVTGSEEKLQVSLDDEQRRWLEEHSLEELQLEFERASLKRGGKSGRSSQYRGVSANRGKWRAQLRRTMGGKMTYVLQASFDSETDAAHAYDCAAVRWLGWYVLSTSTQYCLLRSLMGSR